MTAITQETTMRLANRAGIHEGNYANMYEAHEDQLLDFANLAIAESAAFRALLTSPAIAPEASELPPIKTWMHRLGPDYNDSKEPTAHEIAMEAEITELRAAIAMHQAAAEPVPTDSAQRMRDALEQIAKIDSPQPTDIENGKDDGGTLYTTQVIALTALSRKPAAPVPTPAAPVVAEGWKIVPVEPSEEMLRVQLAVDWPATYKEYLRHPNNGEKSAADTEREILKAKKRWAAMLFSAPAHPVAGSPAEAEPDKDAVLEQAAEICDDLHHKWRWDNEPDSDSGPRSCAAAIRAAKGGAK